MNNQKMWTDSEILFLSENYVKLNKDQLISKLERSWSSIRQKARLLKLGSKKNANIVKISNETNEGYYWLGFLIADGHFNSSGQLEVNLSKKDLQHLKRFADFIEYKKVLVKPRISINYREIEGWLSQFEIMHNKTYNPCSFSHLTEDRLFSFIIGFIDGDGSIDKRGCLQIKCHKVWLANLTFMIQVLSQNPNYQGTINKEGLAIVWLTKIEIMKKIRRHAELLSLPFLERKWSRVQLGKLSKTERHDILINQCVELFDLGLLPKVVIKKINVSRSFVYNAYKLWQAS